MQDVRRLLVIVAVVAAAAIPCAVSAATFGAEVFGAYNTYSMGDVNDEIDALNTTLGSNFDDFSGGITGGLGLRMWASPQFLLAAHWEPLFLETEDSGAKINMDANSYQLTGGYFFPSTSNAKYGVGAGVGYYTLGGELSGGGVSQDVDGSGVGFHFLGMGEWTMSPGFAVTAAAGYRVASFEIDDSAPSIDAEYSGFMSRLGVAFYMPTK